MTNGRQLRYLSTSNEESAKLFMVIDLLLQESVVVMIDFVDALRSSMVLERTIHGRILGRWRREYIARGFVWAREQQAMADYTDITVFMSALSLYSMLSSHGSQADGYWMKSYEKLSIVSLGTSIKVKRRDEERQRRESLTSINHLLTLALAHSHSHLTSFFFLIHISSTNMPPRQRELTKHQYSAGLTYVAQKPSFLQNFGKPQVPPPSSSSASSRGGREPLPERPDEGRWASGSGDESAEQDEEEDDDEWGDVFGGGEEGPQVVVLKEGRHLTAEEIKRERRKGGFKPICELVGGCLV